MSLRQACGDSVKKGAVSTLNAVGLEPIDEIKHFYKIVTFWGFLLVMLIPDLYNLAVSYHLIDASEAPEALTHLVNVIGFLGAAIRLVRSKRKAKLEN